MPKRSAGILMYRRRARRLEVFLVHPGGPYWAGKDSGVWSIPKGELAPDEDALSAARREFTEETGFQIEGAFERLGSVRQGSGKIVQAWAVESDCDPQAVRSNAFEIEWPPRSGQRTRFPEIDRAAWFDVAEARRRILPGQMGFLDALCRRLSE